MTWYTSKERTAPKSCCSLRCTETCHSSHLCYRLILVHCTIAISLRKKIVRVRARPRKRVNNEHAHQCKTCVHVFHSSEQQFCDKPQSVLLKPRMWHGTRVGRARCPQGCFSLRCTKVSVPDVAVRVCAAKERASHTNVQRHTKRAVATI